MKILQLGQLHPQGHQHCGDHCRAQQTGDPIQKEGWAAGGVEGQGKGQGDDRGGFEDGEERVEFAALAARGRCHTNRKGDHRNGDKEDRRRDQRLFAQTKFDEGQAEVAHIAKDGDENVRPHHFPGAAQQPGHKKSQQGQADLHNSDKANHPQGQGHRNVRFADDIEDKGRGEQKIGETGEGAGVQRQPAAGQRTDEDESKDGGDDIEKNAAQLQKHTEFLR